MKRLRVALLVVITLGATACVADDLAGKSAWYCFDSIVRMGESIGANPWPAIATGHEYTRHNGILDLPGERGNGLYLINPVSFFGVEAPAGTIAMRVKPAFDPAAETGQSCLIDFMKQAGNTKIDGYEIVIFTDAGKLHAKPALTSVMSIDTPLKQDQWTHIAMTWDCTRGTAFFVDGEQVAQRNGAFKPTPLEPGWPGRVGCHTSSGGFPFAGGIDDLRLFNHELTPEQVKQVSQQRPLRPNIESAGDWGDAVRITNREDEAITLALEVWLPERHAQPPFWGPIPVDYRTTGFIPGCLTTEKLVSPAPLAPGETREFRIPQYPNYLGPRRYRAMVGEGIAAHEIAETELFMGGSFALLGRGYDPFGTSGAIPGRGVHGEVGRTTGGRRVGGLSLRATKPQPVVEFSDQPLEIKLWASHSLPRAIEGHVLGRLLSLEGEELATATALLTWEPGDQPTLRFGRSFAPGSYNLRLYFVEGSRETLVNEFPVHTTRNEDARTICDVGAAYTTAPDDPETLQAMADDGVAVLRMSPKSSNYAFNQTMSAMLKHGFKAWHGPMASYHSVCADRKKLDAARRKAKSLGRYLRDNPAVINQVFMGEGLSYPPCYCSACDRAFIWSLKKAYGLDALNEAWGREYSSWDEVEQLGSPEDVDDATERLKIMQVALELPKGNTERWQKLFELDRPRAMAWKRWHDSILVDWYRELAEAFHEENEGNTPLGEQPCWANFKHHILFALGDIADIGGTDLYLPGEMPTTLGYAAELFLNFDMNAHIFGSRDKPIMLHEMYVQDISPELLPEAQGWWLTGRGYNMVTFFTHNYYHEGVRANLPLVFGMFDKEGKPYPNYPSFRRFSRDLKTFDSAHDFQSMRPEKPLATLCLSDDMSIANALESGGATWNAAGVHGHNGAYWLCERNGYPMAFANEARLSELGRTPLVVVPWSHVISQRAVRGIINAARRGATVLIDGPMGLVDQNYQPYEPLPGGPAAAELGISFSGYQEKPNEVIGPNGAEIPSFGYPLDAKIDRGEVLFRDAEGRPAVVEVPVGRGRVIYLLSNLGRVNRSRQPDPDALALWQSLMQKRCTPRHRYEPAMEIEADATQDLDHGGRGIAGASLFDVSARVKGDRELFLFTVSFFGPSRGNLSLDLPEGSYEAADALTGEAVSLERTREGYALPVDLPAFGSRVVRVAASGDTRGRPFRNW